MGMGGFWNLVGPLAHRRQGLSGLASPQGEARTYLNVGQHGRIDEFISLNTWRT
ncbi:hypothetical protein BJX64DRAFT_270552 [Aspergillus heterothallicus]